MSWAGGAFTPDDAQHKFAVRDGHLAAVIADDTATARVRFAGLPPFIAAFFAHLPTVVTPEDAVQRVQQWSRRSSAT